MTAASIEGKHNRLPSAQQVGETSCSVSALYEAYPSDQKSAGWVRL